MTLKIAVVPLDVAYASPQANIEAVTSLSFEPDTDLIVLPELFSTGFIKKPEKLSALAQTNSGPTMAAMRRLAAERGAAVAGSFLATDGRGSYFNRAFLVTPEGEEAFYDKHNLFTHSGEHLILTPGSCQSPVVNYRGWRIKLMVCFDLRFPVWSVNSPLHYDLLLVPSNWPEQRSYAFRHLLIARAIENQAVVVGANRGGADPFGSYPASMTKVYDWLGRPLSAEGPQGVVYACADRAELEAFRKSFPILG